MGQQLTGTEAILYFAPTVLPGGSKRDKFFGNVGVGSAKFIGELLASYMADSETALLGRRTLTIGGSAGVCLGLAIFAKFRGQLGAAAPRGGALVDDVHVLAGTRALLHRLRERGRADATAGEVFRLELLP